VESCWATPAVNRHHGEGVFRTFLINLSLSEGLADMASHFNQHKQKTNREGRVNGVANRERDRTSFFSSSSSRNQPDQFIIRKYHVEHFFSFGAAALFQRASQAKVRERLRYYSSSNSN
jgi:hypothetical protein